MLLLNIIISSIDCWAAFKSLCLPNASSPIQDMVSKKSKGRVKQLAMSHKASRVLQSILKYGTPEHKKALAAEALPELAILAKDTYGTHLARKLVDEAPKTELPNILKAIRGGCVALARHPHGAPVLEAR